MAKDKKLLNKLIAQIAKGLNFLNYHIRIESVSSNGANYTSNLYSVTITEGDRMVYLFAKVAAIGDKMRLNAPKIYEIENFVYTKVLKAYERLQDEHHVFNEHRITFCKFYGYEPTVREEIIVLEDLVPVGFKPYDRMKSIEWDYAKSAVTEMAKMHSLAFAYNEYYSEDFFSVMDELKVLWKTEPERSYYEGVRRKTIETTLEEHKDKIQRFLDTHKGEMYRNMYNKWGRRPVLGHGDFRPSNLLHRVREVSSTSFVILKTVFNFFIAA